MGSAGDPTPFKPSGTYSRSFDFRAPVSDVYACIAAHYPPKQKGDPWSYGATQTWFVDSGGQEVALCRNVPVGADGITCALVIWDVDPPTWFEREVDVVKQRLHME